MIPKRFVENQMGKKIENHMEFTVPRVWLKLKAYCRVHLTEARPFTKGNTIKVEGAQPICDTHVAATGSFQKPPQRKIRAKRQT